jgi:hypothetical protein
MPVLNTGLSGPAPVVNVAEERREAHAASITRIEEDAEYDRRRFEERQAARREVESEHEELMLQASGVPMCFWPKHTAGYQRWRAFEDQLDAEHREDERLRKERLIEQQQAAWRWHHPADEPIPEEKPSWLTSCRASLRDRRRRPGASRPVG